MQKLLLVFLLSGTSVAVQAQKTDKPKTQATTMVAINQPKDVDTTTSPNVRAMIQILRNKHKYVGQPFSVLLKDLPDTIRYFYPIHEFENVTPPKASIFAFGFIDYQQVQQNFFDSKFSYYKRALVHISWQRPVKLDDIKHFLIENNNWNSQIKQFFAPLIVQDIELGEPVEVSKAGGWLNWP